MAKATKSTCVHCREKFLTSEMHIVSNKKYCEDCYNKYYESKAKEQEDWVELYEYIRSELGLSRELKEQVPAGIVVTLQRYKSEYNFTSFGMLCCLKYMKDILGKNFKDDDRVGIGLIPYYYQETSNYYQQKQAIEDYSEGFVFKRDERIIKAKLFPTCPKRNKRKILEFDIDEEDLEEGSIKRE